MCTYIDPFLKDLIDIHWEKDTSALSCDIKRVTVPFPRGPVHDEWPFHGLHKKHPLSNWRAAPLSVCLCACLREVEKYRRHVEVLKKEADDEARIPKR